MKLFRKIISSVCAAVVLFCTQESAVSHADFTNVIHTIEYAYGIIACLTSISSFINKSYTKSGIDWEITRRHLDIHEEICKCYINNKCYDIDEDSSYENNAYQNNDENNDNDEHQRHIKKLQNRQDRLSLLYEFSLLTKWSLFIQLVLGLVCVIGYNGLNFINYLNGISLPVSAIVFIVGTVLKASTEAILLYNIYQEVYLEQIKRRQNTSFCNEVE